ncbi:MAG: hypothetical protein O3B04_03350 [Chloroflexi bacterium]|nr:hypothetical protein [Chloroflexota bacterium]MDA1297025.1 hypothetical protein [Chloroflexota bacterium]
MTPDPSDVQALFARHYFYFAMLATLGALQIAVSIGGYPGLWVLPHRLGTRMAGAILIIAGAALFFMLPLWVDGPWAAGSVEADSSTRQWGRADWGDLGAARNVNDIDGGLSGTGQATWFPLAALIAFCVSITAGAANRRLFPARMARMTPISPGTDASEGIDDEDGIALLRRRSYPGALKTSWRRFRRELPADAMTLLAQADRWSVAFQVWHWVLRRKSR